MNTEVHQLTNILPCGYIITSQQGIINYVNNFMLKLLHYPDNYVLNKTTALSDLLPMGVKVYFETHLNPILIVQGHINEVSLDLKRSDGVLVPVLVNAKCIFNKNATIANIHYTFFDISQRKKFESELLLASQKQEQLINSLKQSNNDFVKITEELERTKNYYKNQNEINKHISKVGKVGGWEIDLITGLLTWSDVTKEIHEINKNEQPDLAKGIGFFKEGPDRERITSTVLKCIKTTEPFDEELQIITANGTQKWVRVLGFAEATLKQVTLHKSHVHLKAPENSLQTIRLYGTFQDIDKQKNMMLQLEQNNSNIKKDNAYLNSIIENNSFYIIKTDLEGNYTYFNPYFIKMLGVNSDDWMGKNSLGLIIPEDHNLCIDVVNLCFKQPEKSHYVTLRKPALNEIVTNQWEFTLLKDEDGNFFEFLCIGYEITPLIKKQEELKKLLDITSIQNTRLQNFTHIVSHNIRSHVANLRGIINITDVEDIEERTIAWKMIKNTVTLLDETIYNLNEIIHVQTVTQLPIVSINISHEINRVIKGLRLLIVDTKTQFYFNFDKYDTLNSNVAYFESIVLNLITNAIKYKSADSPPQIHIGLQTIAHFKVLSIKDNGLGLDLKQYGDKLFGMYKTFHGNKDAKGLGLFISKTQIEAMGGKIEMESNPGQGSTLKVYFPENQLRTIK